MKPDLYAPISYGSQPCYYFMASKAQVEAVANGCGPKGKGYLVPDTMYGLSINPACQIHDWMYAYGKTEDDKNLADEVFHRNLNAIIDAESTWILKWLRRMRADEYYLAVREFGDSAFWDGKL